MAAPGSRSPPGAWAVGRHVPASRAAVVAALEPVLAALFAWLIHDEALAAVQLAGGLIVVASVAWVQSHRPDAAEAAPAPRRRSQPAAVRPPA